MDLGTNALEAFVKFDRREVQKDKNLKENMPTRKSACSYDTL